MHMKFSLYNSIISIIDKHTLLYNSLSGKFVIIRNKIMNAEDLSNNEFMTDYPALHQQLKDAGIIIDDETDEISLLEERIRNADNNESEYILHINPTLDCNFRCWYCYENHIPYSKMSREVLESTLKHIDSILLNTSIKSFELGFFGGEPLYYFKDVAGRIISHTKSLCDLSGVKLHVHFTSNGALINNDIVNFLRKISCGFQITLDGGKEFHDKTRFHKKNEGSFDIIVKNIHRLISADVDVIVRVNYTAENIDSIEYILDSFEDVDAEQRKHLKFDFQRVWQDKKDRNDTTEQKIRTIRKIFRDRKYIVLSNYIPHDVSNSCYGDKINHTLINYDGLVFGCTARDFTPANSIGKLEKTGQISFDDRVVKKRNTSKLSKQICKTCRIAPICGGGCKQRAMESLGFERCNFNYSQDDIDNIIMDIFEYHTNINQE